MNWNDFEDNAPRHAPAPPTEPESPLPLECSYCGIDADDPRAQTACVSLKNPRAWHVFIAKDGAERRR